MSIPVILDCDPGHDDAFNILLAAAHPAVELLGITTVAGNQTVGKTTLNARRVCTVAGIEGVPIAAGMAGPLRGPGIVAPDIHGESGLDGPGFGEPTVPVDGRDAVTFLRDTLRAHPVPVTLVPTGPLTNIAAFLLAHPELADRIERVVLMGGSTGRGNRTPAAEFNVLADPEAADVVFRSGLHLTMIGLNVSHRALATPRVVARVRALGTPLAGVCAELLTYFGDAYREVFGFPAPPLHDPLTVAHLVAPDLVTLVHAPVAIELTGTHTRGATVVDLDGVTGARPNAYVGVDVDVDAYWDLIVDAVRTLG
ncbi:nucleoside hydrolase [Streptomyces roseolilacinus]|uniref:Ribosylpyrimidine nucleosidase n=1 Tax=Streptomyces roseolilacinus TaxID=66904 RepID=A0A918B210_9ACTN|nr:nucleoside hydrolase [Streptomyces roseolilacinus]GGQ07850.1 ribosylpyrimidine nucleosidase [Streptomyces roseolilacinus]